MGGIVAIPISGVGATGPAPGPAPAAPNLTGATVNINYVPGNNFTWYLSGTVDTPAGAGAIASIIVQIVGLNNSAEVINAPTSLFPSLSTVTFQTPQFALPLSSTTYTVNFIVVSASGVATTSPYSTTVTITPTAVNTLSIAEVSGARTLTIGNQSTSIAVTPALSSNNGIQGAQQITFWFSRDGGTTLYLDGWKPFYPGVTTVIDLAMGITSNSGGLTSNNFIIYAVVGAYSSPGSPSSPISYATLLAAYPSVVTSNAITLLPAAPTASATLTLKNSAGSSPTQANIYMGYNGANLPYAQINYTIATPGGIADPNDFSYSLYCRWEDSLGNPLSYIGGINSTVVNTPGYQIMNGGILNQGQTFSSFIAINYPAPSIGSDAYLTFYLFGFNPTAAGGGGSQVPPFTGNTGVLLQALQGVQIGQPPTGLLGQQNTASVNPTPATSIIPDGNFSLDQLAAFPQASQWTVGNPGLVVGSGTVMNDGVGSSTGGIQNYCRIQGPFQLTQLIQMPASQALYFACAARSNNPTLSVIAQVSQSGTASGMTPGTYTGIACNGASGTGGVVSITVNATTVLSATITAPGSAYVSNSTFTVTVPSGVVGGTGVILSVRTGGHTLFLAVEAYDSNGNNIVFSGNAFTVGGSIPSWENAATSGVILFPANTSYFLLILETTGNEPGGGYWDVTNILLQPVQNQTIGSQINSQVPQTQTSGMTAVNVTAPSTSASVAYGLSYIVMEGTASENVTISTDAGTAAVGAGVTGGGNCSMISSSTSGQLNIDGPTVTMSIGSTGGTTQITFTGVTSLSINGNVGFTGAVAGRNSVHGIVT